MKKALIFGLIAISSIINAQQNFYNLFGDLMEFPDTSGTIRYWSPDGPFYDLVKFKENKYILFKTIAPVRFDQIVTLKAKNPTVLLTRDSNGEIEAVDKDSVKIKIKNTDLTSSTGLSLNKTTGIITNTAPDQTIVLTEGNGVDIAGTYPNFTISETEYTNTAVTASNGTVTFYLTSDKTSAGTAKYSTLTYKKCEVSDAENSYNYAYSLSSDKKILTVTVKRITVILGVLQAPTLAPSGIPIDILVKGY